VLFDIDEMVIRPVAQATATVVARKVARRQGCCGNYGDPGC